ncbi:MAG: hypothetical protein MJ193_00360, partial [Clostridia bacterium]|nr:hypothetical protein [Clostridia bacterium]
RVANGQKKLQDYVDENTTIGQLAAEIQKGNFSIEITITNGNDEDGKIAMNYYAANGNIMTISDFDGNVTKEYEYIKGDIAYSFSYVNYFFNEETMKTENYPDGKFELEDCEKYDKMFAGQQDMPVVVEATEENKNDKLSTSAPEGAVMTFENGMVKLSMEQDMGGTKLIMTMYLKDIGTTKVEIPAECAEKEAEAEWKTNIDFKGVNYSMSEEYNIETGEWELSNDYNASIYIDEEDEEPIYEYTILAKVNGMPVTGVSAYTDATNPSAYKVNVYFNEDGQYVGDYADIEEEVSFYFDEGIVVNFS